MPDRTARRLVPMRQLLPAVLATLPLPPGGLTDEGTSASAGLTSALEALSRSPPPHFHGTETAYSMINTGQTVDDFIAAFEKDGLTPLMPSLSGDGVQLPDSGATPRDTPAMRTAVPGPGGKISAKYTYANVRIPPTHSTRDGLGAPASATARSTADGGTNA